MTSSGEVGEAQWEVHILAQHVLEKFDSSLFCKVGPIVKLEDYFSHEMKRVIDHTYPIAHSRHVTKRQPGRCRNYTL